MGTRDSGAEPAGGEADPLATLRAEVRALPLPRHVAIIMDGNGRWAESRGQGRLEGHRRGSEAVRATTRAARRLGVEYLTLYAFSMQNWSRPADEVAGLMALLGEYLRNERAELLDNGVRLHAIGDLDRLPASVREPLETLRKDTAGQTGMTLTLALSYGGREELVQAARALVAAAERGELTAADVDEQTFADRLWTRGLPDPDVVVRTSGELRLSNFLPYQLSYAEIVVTDRPWPEFGERDLLLAVEEFQRRERRYGKTGAQVRLGAGR